MAAIPVPYIGTGNNSQVVLGHYGVAQLSGAIAATPTALDPWARIRWAPSNTSAYLALMRVKVGFNVISAVTTTVRQSIDAIITRGFTVDFTTAITNINMGTVSKTNAMRSNMGNSLMGTAGPGICTTAPLSGHTYTLDNAPFAMTTWGLLYASTSTGTAVALPAGAAGNTTVLYEWTGLGQHPVILSNLEGVSLRCVHTGHATGTCSLQTQWEWGETLVF